jgi:hypothetical protein
MTRRTLPSGEGRTRVESGQMDLMDGLALDLSLIHYLVRKSNAKFLVILDTSSGSRKIREQGPTTPRRQFECCAPKLLIEARKNPADLFFQSLNLQERWS